MDIGPQVLVAVAVGLVVDLSSKVPVVFVAFVQM